MEGKTQFQVGMRLTERKPSMSQEGRALFGLGLALLPMPETSRAAAERALDAQDAAVRAMCAAGMCSRPYRGRCLDCGEKAL